MTKIRKDDNLSYIVLKTKLIGVINFIIWRGSMIKVVSDSSTLYSVNEAKQNHLSDLADLADLADLFPDLDQEMDRRPGTFTERQKNKACTFSFL